MAARAGARTGALMNVDRAQKQSRNAKKTKENELSVNRRFSVNFQETRMEMLNSPRKDSTSYQAYLKVFQQQGKVVEDVKEVNSWPEEAVAGWIASLDGGRFQPYAKCFITHQIDGPALLRVDENVLHEIEVDVIGDRLKLADHIEQLHRRCIKPESANLEIPNYQTRIVRMLDFGWADTSEGKGGRAIKEELVGANSAIALVSTLTWSIAWDLFFGCNTSCYCQVGTDHCYCSTAWDIDGRPLVIFYCFSGFAAFFFMFSTIYAIIQIMMVNEMSDDEEIDVFFELLKSDSQLPGILLFVGMMCFMVPVAVYLIYNINLGLYPGPATTTMTIFSWIVSMFTLFLAIYGFLYKLPDMIRNVYAAKLQAALEDREPPVHFF